MQLWLQRPAVISDRKSRDEYACKPGYTCILSRAFTTRPTLLQSFSMNGFRDVNGLIPTLQRSVICIAVSHNEPFKSLTYDICSRDILTRWRSNCILPSGNLRTFVLLSRTETLFSRFGFSCQLLIKTINIGYLHIFLNHISSENDKCIKIQLNSIKSRRISIYFLIIMQLIRIYSHIYLSRIYWYFCNKK